MKYISTRNNSEYFNYNDVLIQGLSSDGGLFVPKTFPKFSNLELNKLSKLSYSELAAEIISKFTGDDIEFDELLKNTEKVYSNFANDEVAPLKDIGDNNFLLELFHGPTLAFKDYAMQFLAADFERVMKLKNENILILGATSGDTGSAALHAFSNLKLIDIFILYPNGMVSEIQEAQMTTISSDGAFPIKINGNFDDCQNIVKTIFENLDFKKRLKLTAVNSINWARLVPQIVYYFYSALKVTKPGNKVSFSVPTGNFGNIYAGWCAKKMGLPIEKLICASNKNNILTRFFNSGKMEIKPVQKSYSPSMDIQISSNFERLLFEMYNMDSEIVKLKMAEFKMNNSFQVEENLLKDITNSFFAVDVNDEQILETIKDVFKSNNIIIDPHTACGIYSQKIVRKKGKISSSTPIINLACAHPSKFPDTVFKAINVNPELPMGLEGILKKQKRFLHGPNDHKTIMSLIEGNRRN